MLYVLRDGATVFLSNMPLENEDREKNQVELRFCPRKPGDATSQDVELNILLNVLRNAGVELTEEI